MRAALLALFLCAPASAAEPSWTVSADSSALVGAETAIVYRSATAPGAKLAPDVLASGTTDFVVVKAEAGKDGAWTWTILPLDEGPQSFVARWTLDGQPVAAPPVALSVGVPPVAKDAQIEDIRGPAAARRAWWPWLLAAALGAAAWEAWRRWKARPGAPKPQAPNAPPLPPEEAAERALDALRDSGLWERGEHAAYYLRLTEILREYLEARYLEPATAMTSVEVARLVKAKEPDMKAAASARELLARADLVKFARIVPGADEGPNDARLVLELVRATTPREPVPAAAGEGAR